MRCIARHEKESLWILDFRDGHFTAMKILIVNTLFPHPSHSFQSANVIIFELVREFARQSQVKVGFFKINRPNEPGPSLQEKEGMDILRTQGVDILPSLLLPPGAPSRSTWRKAIFPKVTDFYPEVVHRVMVTRAIMRYAPDLIFVPISEWVTALCADVPITKFAYYGNPDPKSALARVRFDFHHGTSNLRQFLVQQVLLRNLERVHLAEMKKYELFGDLAENDLRWYQAHGLPNAFYTRNVWVDRLGEGWRTARRIAEQETPAIIAANTGRLSATANTHGLEILGRDMLPALRRTVRMPYELHLFGVGTPHPAIRHFLNAPEVHSRGFVEDIDHEMLKAKVFLCVNNASAYKVGHTRYLHAWSLGACVVAHVDAALSMPEIVHGKNALLGRTPDEIASLVAQALSDSELRARIGEGGYNTFRDYFLAERVVPQIMERIIAYRIQQH